MDHSYGNEPTRMSNDYDALDVAYRKIWGAHLHHGLWESPDDTLESATERMAQRVIEGAEISPTHHVCDIGCGNGATARMVVRKTGAKVTAVTNARKQYEAAAAEGNENPHYVLGTWPEHSFAAGSFDRVIVIEALEHMPDRVTALQAMAEVLKPEGRLVLHTWVKRTKESLLLDFIQREGSLAGMGTEDEILAGLEEAGFVIVRCDDLSAQVARTWSAALCCALRGMFSDRELRRFFLANPIRNARLGLALVLTRVAYALGALGYRSIVAEKR